MGPESIFQIVLASLLTQKPIYLSPWASSFGIDRITGCAILWILQKGDLVLLLIFVCWSLLSCACWKYISHCS